MPSNFLSKLHSGPVKRSCVSVAAIGWIQSGKFGITVNIEGSRQKAERRKKVADGRRQENASYEFRSALRFRKFSGNQQKTGIATAAAPGYSSLETTSVIAVAPVYGCYLSNGQR